MSLAGKESSQGDEYQLQVALHWCINVLQNDNIDYLSIELITRPNTSEKVEVDDIYIQYKNNNKKFIQAKKNATDFNEWKLSNPTLKKEIQSAYLQYKKNDSNPTHKIEFYSRTPFGDFNKIVEKVNFFGDYSSFNIAPVNQSKLLIKISEIISQSENETFNFLLSINFGSTKSLKEWNESNLERLRYSLINPDLAKPYLESILREHQINENNRPTKLNKSYLENELQKKGLILTPKYEENEILNDFKKSSKIGRGKDYSIRGKYLTLKDKETVLKFLNENNNATCVITNKAGSGKSYLLDETANYIENNTKYALLFIKGDMFTKISNDEDFANQGMPKDLIGKIGRLSESRKVVIIIDSLDVIALNKEHGTLNYFISLIDRLNNVSNVILLIACRTFDLKYDANLRDRKWDKKLEIKEYNFNLDIEPFLELFNINTFDFSESLKKLLIIPQRPQKYSPHRFSPIFRSDIKG